MFLALYLSGYHTVVISYIQRGVLQTGIFSPATENKAEAVTANLSLQLRHQNGQEVQLKEFEGKPIFLNFWASWCAPCLAEMPGINEAALATDNRVNFVLVTVEEDITKAQAFMKRKGYALPVYQLAASRPAMYQSSSVPTTYIINSQGELVATYKGIADYSSEDFIHWLLSI